MRRWFTGFIIILLQACTPLPIRLGDGANIKPLHDLPIKTSDLRPHEEKLARRGSYVITSCDYAINRIDDSRLIPDRITYLANFVNKKFSHKENDQVLVYRFEIYMNSQAALRKSPYLRNPGLVISLLQLGECYAPPDSRGGVNNLTENPKSDTMAVIHLDIEFRGARLQSRYAQPLVGGATENLFSVMDNALNDFFKNY